MRIVADIHNHSRFSRACSPELTIPNLESWAQKKGVNLITVADFTHPAWIKECEENLVEDGESGFYFYTDSDTQGIQNKDKVRFMFTTELSFIYKRHEKTRRVHNIVLAPNIQAVKKLNTALINKGFNVKSDGRPILGMSCRDFLEFAKEIDERIEVIPAHIWTPWFALFGSKSGYDSVEECYGDMSKYIFALETGLSSDPMMNYMVSALDRYILVSNSDSHSLKNIARECNVLEMDDGHITYDEFIRILKEKDISKFLYTVEFYPEEGRYHYDGHRDCGIVLSPQESLKQKNICPKCKKPLTLGVEHRVVELADREYGYEVPNRPGYKKIVELDKVIAQSFGLKSRTGKKVLAQYESLISAYGSELHILLDQNLQQLTEDGVDSLLVEGLYKNREGKLNIKPGYDGEYGVVDLFSQEELAKKSHRQSSLF